MVSYAVVDCDNCFVSCERVFRPDLKGRPVVVLSNNDGCVVARSNEAKQLGVKMGMPFFKMKQEFPNAGIVAFSGNYELYGNITARVMSIVSRSAPEFYRYSIDEAFVVFRNGEETDMKRWGERLSEQIARCVGVPVSIGVAPNKTLAKIASHFAKHYPGYHHCCVIDSDEKREKALRLSKVDDVWGVGRRMSARLHSMGIATAYDFATRQKTWVNASFNVVALRTWQELNGEDVIPMEDSGRKKSICVSRSFPKLISDIDTLRRYVSNYAARCAESLRKQSTYAGTVGVFLSTNRFREDLDQYSNYAETQLLTSTNATVDMVKIAEQTLMKIWRPGLFYKKAGVVVSSIVGTDGVQTNLVDYDADHFEKMTRLDRVVDQINRVGGRQTVTLGAQHFSETYSDGKTVSLSDAVSHQHRSPSYTTRWSDIIELK